MDPAFQPSMAEDARASSTSWKGDPPFENDPLLCSAPESYGPFDKQDQSWMPGSFQPDSDNMDLDANGAFFGTDPADYNGPYGDGSPYGSSFLLPENGAQLQHQFPDQKEPQAYPEETEPQDPVAFYGTASQLRQGSGPEFYQKSLFTNNLGGDFGNGFYNGHPPGNSQNSNQNQQSSHSNQQSGNQSNNAGNFGNVNGNGNGSGTEQEHPYGIHQYLPEETTFSIPSSDNASPNDAARQPYNLADTRHHFTATPTYSSPKSGDDSVHAFVNPADDHPSALGVPTDVRDSASHRTSISAGVNELSPLTTTTSFTPSVSSLHSTQPSFFSAQQFLRPSMEQPPSSIHRGSLDLYQRHRLSIDSSNSGANVPQRPPRSFTSYFSFMDRDRKQLQQGDSPISNGWSPSAASQPRHSIRRIFKTGHQQPQGETDPSMDPSALNDSMAPFSDEYNSVYTDGHPSKVTKRPKRGLFDRLKVRVNSSGPAEDIDSPFLEREGEFADEELKTSDHSLSTSQKSDHGPSKTPNGLQHLHSGSSAGESVEPDYGALFSGVGKRRNLVGMKNKKRAEHVKKEAEAFLKKEYEVSVKRESDAGIKSEPESSHHGSDGRHSHTFGDNSGDCLSASSMSNSQKSTFSKESAELPNQGGSAFANASKRILGARLLKKKNNVKSETPSSDVVEIDLQSLDLPQDTQIIPQGNSTSRTRGRKEDKAADMEDQSKIFVCGYCSRRFKRQEHLKRHFRSLHTSQKPYDCPFCPKKFSRTDNLNQHLKVHKQEEEERQAMEESKT